MKLKNFSERSVGLDYLLSNVILFVGMWGWQNLFVALTMVGSVNFILTAVILLRKR
jgi:hypothetical protein